MAYRILLTGGGGRLAREIKKIDSFIDAPVKLVMDFSDYHQIKSYCQGKRFDVIIHAGGVINKFDEDVDENYIHSNIIGTANVTLWAKRNNVRLVYISSDYVYPSERGDYTEESVLMPVNRYAKSKLGGEMAVQLYNNSLIIRTSFYGDLNFSHGCSDQYTSRIAIKDAAAAIYYLACREDVLGIINFGTNSKRSLLQIIQSEWNPAVRACLRKDLKIPYIIPPDSSLHTRKFFNMMVSMTSQSKVQSLCRICGSKKLYKYLDLGYTPLANSYVEEKNLEKAEYKEELAILLCTKCGLSQLTKVVNPDLMFKNYLYVSSTTKTFRDHCVEMVSTTVKVVQAKSGDWVLDIASNDGCLLSQFREVGLNVLGVDPAENLASEANAKGIKTLCAYWSKPLAKDIVSRFGMPLIITATNVFAHVDDLNEFVEAVKICLAPKGIFIVECPYVMDFIAKSEFDTAYHEHLSYIGIYPLSILFDVHGMKIFYLQYFENLHGGTIRVFICQKNDFPVHHIVDEYLQVEKTFGITARQPYDLFAERIKKNKESLRKLIFDLRSQGKTIWAYGASAKGNTLMNFFELGTKDIPVVIDDNPKKWGYYTPGSKMHIVSIDDLAQSKPDYLLLLAWNFEREIRNRCKDKQYKGDFIVPIPEATIVRGEK